MTVLVTSFQKEASIYGCLNQLVQVLDDADIPFHIVLLDDASSDSTVLEASRIKDQRITIRQGASNLGKGKLIRQNVDSVSDAIVGVFDGDLDLHPKTLVEGYILLTSNQTIGAAVGSKLHSLSIVDYPFKRRVLSRVFQFVSHLMFGLSIGDTQTGAKVFRTADLATVCKHSVADGFVFDLEVLVRMNSLGLKVVEIPIELDYKFDSTIGIGSTMKTGRDILRVWRAIR